MALKSTMDLFFLSVSLTLTITALALTLFTQRRRRSSANILPHGSFGWPIISETIEFMYGKPEKFVTDRMKKYSRHIFKTKILGERTAVICGPAENKFLFSNEQKLVTAWRPHSMQKLYNSAEKKTAPPIPIQPQGIDTEILRTPGFLKPQALKLYMAKMDSLTQQHLDKYWKGREKVEVYPLSAIFTLSTAGSFFMDLDEDHEHERVTKLAKRFDDLTFGQHAIAIDFSGTMFNRASRAAAMVRKEFMSIIKERKEAVGNGY